jgi:K+-sensing histidine kinase KdpD
MQDELESEELYQKFQLLAVTDPKEARVFFNQLLDANDPRVIPLLEAMSEPGEGRVRQLVANAVRSRTNKEALIKYLLRWQAFESDEFARRAIEAALEDVDVSTLAVPAKDQQENQGDELASKDAVVIYRWIAERLCHRVRNALTDPVSNLTELERLAGKIQPPLQAAEVLSEIGQFKIALTRISRIVEFDISDPYFVWKEISIWPWLRKMAADYASRYDPIELKVLGEASKIDVKIRSNELLLETIFWNLWKDSGEAVGKGCRVEIIAEADSTKINLVLVDNGPGLTMAQSHEAFQASIPTKGLNRGHGLLEVADAVGRLHGSASIIRTNDGSYRINLSFPRV